MVLFTGSGICHPLSRMPRKNISKMVVNTHLNTIDTKINRTIVCKCIKNRILLSIFLLELVRGISFICRKVRKLINADTENESQESIILDSYIYYF